MTVLTSPARTGRCVTTSSTVMSVGVQKASPAITVLSILMSVRAAHASMGASVMTAGLTTPASAPPDIQVREGGKVRLILFI